MYDALPYQVEGEDTRSQIYHYLADHNLLVSLPLIITGGPYPSSGTSVCSGHSSKRMTK